MLKSERRPKLESNPNSNPHHFPKTTYKSKPQPPPTPSSVNLRSLLKPLSDRTLDPNKRQSRGPNPYTQKQNKAANHNTPKLEEVLDHQMNSDEMDQLSQIKFISKECSSIKQNQIDADFNSQNQLLDFSPLFDRQTLKDDFILQIQDISETDLFSDSNNQFYSHRNKFSQRTYAVSRQTTLEARLNLARKLSLSGDQDNNLPTDASPILIEEDVGKVGKIKKNRAEPKLSLKETRVKAVDQSEDWIDQEIAHLFNILNEKNQLKLTKNNCRSQTLSTEVNYLIGSILNKIKVKGKHYNSWEFETEFRTIVQDSDKQELKQILSSNRKKHNLKSSIFDRQLENRQSSNQISPSFPESKTINIDLNHKISCISEKLSFYLAKNKLCNDQHLKSQTLKGFEEAAHQYRTSQGKFKEFKQQIEVAKDQDSKTEFKQITDQIVKDSLKTQCSLRKDYEFIKGNEGQQFSLVFTELNKHLE